MSSLIWKPEVLCDLFGINWDNTQLKAVAADLKVPKQCSIAGGAVVRTLLGIDLFKGDIDIFSHTEDGFERALKEYGASPNWEKAKHAYNFSYKFGIRETKVQVIDKGGHEVIDKTLKSFDFEHCKFAYLPDHGGSKNLKVKAGQPIIISTMASPTMLAQRKLRLAYVEEPAYTLARAIKYKRMGFDADAAMEQLVTMTVKGMTKQQFCDDTDWSMPFKETDIDVVIATASS